MWGQMKPARRQSTPRTPETSEGNQPSDGMPRPMHSPLPVVPTCVKGIPTFRHYLEAVGSELLRVCGIKPEPIQLIECLAEILVIYDNGLVPQLHSLAVPLRAVGHVELRHAAIGGGDGSDIFE